MEHETTMPADWAIDVAIQRSGVHWSPDPVKDAVKHGTDSPVARTLIELARMIETHETRPLSDEEAAAESVERYFSSVVFEDRANGHWRGTASYACGIMQKLDNDGFIVSRKEINHD